MDDIAIPKTKVKITFRNDRGLRLVHFMDIVAWLHERGQRRLAEELTIRGNKAFEKLQKDHNTSSFAVWTKGPLGHEKI